MRKFKISLTALILLALSACASLGLEPAASLEDRIAYAVSNNAAVRNSAATSAQLGEISREDAARVLAITDQVRLSLNAARVAAGSGDFETAEGRLQLASAILIEVQNFLRSRQ